jgi:hypothetical protein
MTRQRLALTFTPKNAAKMYYGWGTLCVATTKGALQCAAIDNPDQKLAPVVWAKSDSKSH